jgi:hypothetical protein
MIIKLAKLFYLKVYINDCYKIPSFGPLPALAFFSCYLIPRKLMFNHHCIKQKLFKLCMIFYGPIEGFYEKPEKQKKPIKEEAQKLKFYISHCYKLQN